MYVTPAYGSKDSILGKSMRTRDDFLSMKGLAANVTTGRSTAREGRGRECASETISECAAHRGRFSRH